MDKRTSQVVGLLVDGREDTAQHFQSGEVSCHHILQALYVVIDHLSKRRGGVGGRGGPPTPYARLHQFAHANTTPEHYKDIARAPHRT